MPMYEYYCVCGERFEEQRPVDERDTPIRCPNPEHAKGLEERVIRVISLTSFALAGTGWAKDGYGP